MTNLNFWKKISLYSTMLCGIILIALLFFKQYVKEYNFLILLIGGIILFISLFSELMKFILRRKNK